MNGNSSLHHTLQRDYHVAEQVRIQSKIFPQKFREISEGGQLAEIIRTSTTLSGARIERAPEVFTEQYLIEPVLHGLGYLDPTSDKYNGEGPHFIRQPATYQKIEPNQPDYLLKNIDPSVVCIVEAKAANKEQMTGRKQYATSDIQEYLEEDTFCKYLRDINQRFLIGIGTDGFRWTLWIKDLKTGEIHAEVPKVDITPAVKRAAIRLNTIDGEVTGGTEVERNMLFEEFIPSFSEDNLLSHVRSKI